MAFLDDTFTGDIDGSLIIDWSLDENRRSDFTAFLMESEGVTQGRANQIWKQAREFWFQDTGTVTARPQRDRIKGYFDNRLNGQLGFIPTVIGQNNVDSVVNSNPEANYRPRLNSASTNASNTWGFGVSTNLQGIIFVGVVLGNFVVYVPDNSPA